MCCLKTVIRNYICWYINKADIRWCGNNEVTFSKTSLSNSGPCVWNYYYFEMHDQSNFIVAVEQIQDVTVCYDSCSWCGVLLFTVEFMFQISNAAHKIKDSSWNNIMGWLPKPSFSYVQISVGPGLRVWRCLYVSTWQTIMHTCSFSPSLTRSQQNKSLIIIISRRVHNNCTGH